MPRTVLSALLFFLCSVTSDSLQQHIGAVTIDDIFGAALESAHATYHGGLARPVSTASPEACPAGGLVLSTFEEQRQQQQRLAVGNQGKDGIDILTAGVVLPVYITAPSHNRSITTVPNARDGRLPVRVDLAFSSTTEAMIAADENHHLCVGFFQLSRGDYEASNSPPSSTCMWPPAAYVHWCGSPRRGRSFELAVGAKGGRFRTVSFILQSFCFQNNAVELGC